MSELTEAADKLNAALAEAEEQFCRLAGGAGAEVHITPQQRLRFGKNERAWGLSIIDENGNGTPLKSTSMFYRCLAAEALGELLQAVSQSSYILEKRVVEATEKAIMFVINTRGRSELP